MEPGNPPTKLPRIAQHGDGDGDGTESRNSCAERGLAMRKTINGGGDLQINGLGLGLGFSSLRKCGFTFLQMRELEIQTLIYKYMEAGVPVPYHLIFPIWKSMSSLSVTRECSRTSSLFSNYRNKMDAEPRRCRRTDGKKWRCSKDVVSDHKYCQRHLHRGRAPPTSTNYLQPSSSSTKSSTINSDTDHSLYQ